MSKKAVRVSLAVQARKEWATLIALMYAGVLTVMSLLQLYGLEAFIPIIQDYWLPGGAGVATVVACMVIVLQIVSLPYLLRMRVSMYMRRLGRACAILVPIVWLCLALYAVVEGHMLHNSGIAGEKIAVAAGVPQFVVVGILLALATAVVYGLHLRK